MPIHGYPGGVISATPPTVDNTTASGIWTTEKQLQYQAQGVWPPAVAQPISRSLRFNSADSAYLSRTPASASNRKTWTWSGWVKRSIISTDQTIFDQSSSATNSTQIRFLSTDAFRFYTREGASDRIYDTTAVFRDVSAWYHIVVAVDTTQATASDRVKVYFNNALQTISAGGVSQNADTFINSTSPGALGRFISGSNYCNLYLAEINFIDGQQLTPSSFGQTNSNTGVWEPKAFSGTYGTNGFYLSFSDNSGTTSTTLGKDYSGNGNNWTPNNFSVTAGAGNDSLVDTPTSYGTDTGVGGTVRGNYATLNPLTLRGNPTLTNGNLQFNTAASSGGNRGCTSTIGVSSGKWYVEFTVGSNVGYMGVVTGNWPNDSSWWNSTAAYAYFGQDGNVYIQSGGTVKSYSTYTSGDVIGIALDLDNGKVFFSKNNVWQGSSDPAAGTNPAASSLSGTWYIFVTDNNSGTANPALNVNFGQRPFAYTAPSGFKALCTQNLPTPTVAQGDDYFNTVLWTGTSTSSARSITGVGFQPDFVWEKPRSASYTHSLFDAVRGVNKRLSSNQTSAEETNFQYGYLSSFDTDGFTATPGSTGNENWNETGTTYVAWNWKANGAGSSNTAGSITSTVSANTTSGFSIVTFTTPSSNGNYTTGHGLGVAPSMIITKSRSSTTQWPVWHIGLTGGASNKDYNIYLNLTNAQSSATDSWGSAAPNSTTFGVNVGTQWLGSINIVAYCFAAIPGFSAFGSYVGNGSSDGPFVYCGFRPAFLLTKRASTAGAWHIYDSARGTYNINDIYLIPDTSAAENSGNNGIDFLSNGFKLRSTNTGTNENGTTIIYAAFAENPFKYALAR